MTDIKDCSSRQPPFAFSDKAVDVSLCEESLEPVILKAPGFLVDLKALEG